MYAKNYVLAAIPALVAAQSVDPATVSSLSSLYVAEGFNTAAAAYLASQQARPDIFTQVDSWFDNSAVGEFQSTANALTATNAGPLINSALVASYLTYISDANYRSQISSILVEANSIQAGAAAPAQASATPTGAASGSSAAAGASSGAASGSGAAPAPTGSMATSAKPTAAASGSASGAASGTASGSASAASHSNAAMPRQTGLVMAAGVAAGVVGALAAL